MKTIVFTIDRQGHVKVEAQGYTGRSCRDATKIFEDILGGEVLERKEKNDEQKASETEQVGNGY